MEKKIKKFITDYKRIILLGILLAFLTAVCLYFLVPTPPKNSAENNQSVNTNTQLVLDAYNGSGSVTCVLATTDIQGKVWIKDGKLKLEEDDNGEFGNVVFDKGIAYIWKTGEKRGTKIDVEKNPIAKNFISDSMIKKQIEESSADCTAGEISDSTFTIPQGIVFEDLQVNFQSLFNGGGE